MERTPEEWGERARQIIEDELFIAACETVEKQAIEDMLAVPWWRVRRLAEHAARVRAVRDTREALETVMRTGLEHASARQRAKTIV